MKNQRLIAFFLAFMPGLGFSNPQGGQVSQGSATITQQPGYTHIQQSSDRAIINWQSFNIKANEHTHFQQPSSSSATLNRINAANGASQIFGRLSANGNLFLVNNAGIVFGRTARVDVGGLVATTANITDANFMAGRYHFQQSSKYLDSSVINYGNITIRNGGMAALVAPGVENHGVIQANLGTVALGSGTKFTLDFYGDNLIHFDTGSEIKTAARDANGNRMKHGVLQNGKIIADGGRVQISARAAENVVANVINMKGYIQANSVRKVGGTVYLGGGSGTVRVSGKIKARGKYARQRGGHVKIASRKIRITKKAQIDVSGRAGGGKVYIGGNKQGKGPLPNAEELYVGPETLILANAIDYGDGGEVILWSNTSTEFYGNIEAKGGANSGDGGFVEVSGKKNLTYQGLVDLRAPKGNAGTLLLDPGSWTVLASGAAGPNQILADTINNQLSLGNFILDTNTNPDDDDQDFITFSPNAQIQWTTTGIFTLITGGPVTFAANTAINGPNGSLVINAGASITTSDTTSINVANFNLASGAWRQVVGQDGLTTLPAFNVSNDFQITPIVASFQRIAGGNGTQIDPFQLSDVYGLQGIATNINFLDDAYILNSDIDASNTVNWGSGAGFIPIGNPANPFSGEFNGNGNIILDLTINAASNNVGLFGVTNNAAIRNVGLVNANIIGNVFVGSLIGTALQGTTISNTFSDNSTVVGATIVGGLIGFLDGQEAANTLTTSYASGFVRSENIGGGISGGLVGQAIFSDINNTYSTSTVIADDTAGGLVGLFADTGAPPSGSIIPTRIANSYASGEIRGLSTPDPTTINNAGYLIGVASTIPATEPFASFVNPPPVGGGITACGIGNCSAVQSLNAFNGESKDITTYQNAGWSIGTDLNSTWTILNTQTRPMLSMEHSTIIRTPHQLQLIAQDLSNSYIVGNDINLSPVNTFFDAWGTIAGSGDPSGFIPIGSSLAPFVGELNGQNNNIQNLFIERTGPIGLFGQTDGANIINVNLNNAQVTTHAGSDVAGALIGQADNSTITNASSTGIVDGDIGSFIGGLIGISNNSNITNSLSESFITGSNSLGGLIGEANQSTIMNSHHFSGSVSGVPVGSGTDIGGLIGNLNGGTVIGASSAGFVSGLARVGGLIGNASVSSLVQDSESHSNVTGGSSIGGLIGFNSLSTVLNSHSFGGVTGVSEVGGLIGFAVGTSITDSSSNSSTTGQLVQGDTANIGGLVGLTVNATINNSVNFSEVVSGEPNVMNVGGLVGSLLNSQIHDSSNNFTVSATDSNTMNIGGLAGMAANSQIVNSNNSGDITGDINVGGLVGLAGNSSITSSINNSTATVIGTTAVGGLVGKSEFDSMIIDSHNHGELTLNATDVGGLIGIANDTMLQNSTNTGDIFANAIVGGLVGKSENGVSIINSSNTGNILSPGEKIGGLVGEASDTEITGSSNSGNVLSNSFNVGGLLGLGTNTNITNSSNQGNVTLVITNPNRILNVGGLLGEGTNINILNSSNQGDVVATVTGQNVLLNIGGILGEGIDISIMDSFNQGDVIAQMLAIESNFSVGGLVGVLNRGDISNSFNIGFISGTSTDANSLFSVGGLLGRISSQDDVIAIEKTFNAGEIIGQGSDTSVGGIVGLIASPLNTTVNIKETFNAGSVTGTAIGSNAIVSVGGLVGENSGTVINITDSYNQGTVTANTMASSVSFAGSGGIMGRGRGGSISTLSNIYNSGVVARNDIEVIAGGLISRLVGSTVTINNSFWDADRSGQQFDVTSRQGSILNRNNVRSGCFSGSCTPPTPNLSLSQQSTFTTEPPAAAWNFNSVWGIVNGGTYPYLRAMQDVLTGQVTNDLGIIVPVAGVPVELVRNGSTSPTFIPGITDVMGNYAIVINTLGLLNSDIYLAYVDDASNPANTIFNITDGVLPVVDLNVRSILVQDTSGLGLSNTDLVTARGSLVSTNILYNTSGNIIGLSGGADFITLPGTAFTMNDDIDSGRNIIFNGPLTIDGNVRFVGTNSIRFNASVDNINNGGIVFELNDSLSMITTSNNATVDLTDFDLFFGFWRQEVGEDGLTSLPSFNVANNFQLVDGQFRRFAGGNGSAGSPYQLVDVFGLQGLAKDNSLLSQSYILNNDVDASTTMNWNSGQGFEILGNTNNGFTGNFNGDGNAITGLFINRSSPSLIGLFRLLNGATITNLQLINSNITNTSTTTVAGTGALAGRAENASVISNVHSINGTITGIDNVGGLIGGLFEDSSISNASASGSVNGVNNVGGLVGVTVESTVSDVSSSGNVTATNEVAGGLFGVFLGNSISNAISSNGTVSATSQVGGLIGTTFNGTTQITGSSNSRTVMGDEQLGGLVGLIDDASVIITNSNNSGTVLKETSAGFGDVGGLIGLVTFGGNATIDRSFNTGSVVPAIGNNFNMGGLVGNSQSSTLTIMDSFNAGAVSGNAAIGGLVGGATLGNVMILRSYNIGSVTGVATVGGIAGFLRGENTLVREVYNQGRVEATGIPNDPNTVIAIGGIAGVLDDGPLVQQVYNSGVLVVGGINTALGGLVGATQQDTTQMETQPTIANSFWDSDTSGTTDAVGQVLTGSVILLNNRSGCFDGNCIVSGDDVNLSQQATYTTLAPAANWDFTNTWGIINTKTYPFLSAIQGAINGTVTSDGITPLVNKTVVIAVNGAVLPAIPPALTDTNGDYSYIISTLGTSGSTNYLAFLDDATDKANTFFNINGGLPTVNLQKDNIFIQDNAGVGLSSSNLLIAKGNLNGNILYQGIGGANIEVTNGIDLSTLANTSFTFEGDLTGARNVTFNSPVAITNTININTTGNLMFNDTVNASGHTVDINNTSAGSLTFSALAIGFDTLTINNTNNFLVNTGINLNNLIQIQGSGLSNFAGQGLNATNGIDITSTQISGLIIGNSVQLEGINGINSTITANTLAVGGLNGGVMTGTVGGQGGFAAAENSTLLPGAMGIFLMNGCAIPGPCIAPAPGPQFAPQQLLPTVLFELNPEDLFPDQPAKKNPDANACVKASAGGSDAAAEECAQIIIEE